MRQTNTTTTSISSQGHAGHAKNGDDRVIEWDFLFSFIFLFRDSRHLNWTLRHLCTPSRDNIPQFLIHCITYISREGPGFCGEPLAKFCSLSSLLFPPSTHHRVLLVFFVNANFRTQIGRLLFSRRWMGRGKNISREPQWKDDKGGSGRGWLGLGGGGELWGFKSFISSTEAVKCV